MYPQRTSPNELYPPLGPKLCHPDISLPYFFTECRRRKRVFLGARTIFLGGGCYMIPISRNWIFLRILIIFMADTIHIAVKFYEKNYKLRKITN